MREARAACIHNHCGASAKRAYLSPLWSAAILPPLSESPCQREMIQTRSGSRAYAFGYNLPFAYRLLWNEVMEHPNPLTDPVAMGWPTSRVLLLIVILIASAVYLGCIISPPSLMDDVDAVQAQVARNMLTSGNYVTEQIDGLVRLDKAPLIYWTIAASYRIFGVHDWSARIPVALSAIACCWIAAALGIWAFGRRAGFYAGMCMATCVGLFLFTRILIPDAMLTFVVALSLWAFLRALDQNEKHPRLWAAILGASLGVALLLKSLVGVAFPVMIALLYLLLRRQLFSLRTWKRLHLFSGAAIALVIAVPWHVLATLQNPPYFVWTFHSEAGQYHGFFWSYFINEQVLRFLNLRYPRDYDTVPRSLFWILHLVWLFPWSVYFPAIAKLSFKPVDNDDRAGCTRLMALCWIGVILVFFTFSTTQEYYSMPAYPAFALLLGSAMAAGGDWIRRGTWALGAVTAICAAACLGLLFHVHGLPAPGDISSALSRHPKAYTLSLGHMQDLTFDSFAYLRQPLWLAAIAFLIGAMAAFQKSKERAFLGAALMMVLFLHAARIAMVTFDPYLSSRPLARAFEQSPEGGLITQGFYYQFSSVFFYTNRTGFLLSNRRMNLEYGSYAPGAPQVFIDDRQFANLWDAPDRYYFLTFEADLPRYETLVGASQLFAISTSGGKVLLTNHPLAGAGSLQ
jgi:4-amino-4-deoxy-L-arabinose transferase-like glycosyltransferase